MIRVLPENGYESPVPSPSLSGTEFFVARPPLMRGERMRVAYTRESVEATVEGELKERRSLTAPQNGFLENPTPGEDRQLEADGMDEKKMVVGFRDRIGCYTWTWFTMTMATGGISNVLHSSITSNSHDVEGSSDRIAVPYRSDWLRILGVIVFFFNICLFLMNCTFLTLRFRWNPGSLVNSFLSPSESLFIPACVRKHAHS